MKTFYGLNKNGLWYITDKEPTQDQSFIRIEALTWHDAECQLFEMMISIA